MHSPSHNIGDGKVQGGLGTNLNQLITFCARGEAKNKTKENRSFLLLHPINMKADRPRVRLVTWKAQHAWLLTCWWGLTSPSFVTAGLMEIEGMPVFQPEAKPLQTSECPEHCEDLFSKMTDKLAGKRGKVQEVGIVERGEPKSGTGFMMRKGTEALAHFCHYLQRAYGQRSCRVEFPINVVRNLIFEPQLVVDDGSAPPCSCDNVSR